MIEILQSRRKVVGAGVLAAGAVALVPFLARRGTALNGVSDGITVVPGQAPVFTNNPAEVAHWSTLVGRPVRLVGEGGVALGTIAAVEPGAVDPNRPASIRQQPFAVRFGVEAIGAAPVEGIYDIGTSIEGLNRLFLQPNGPRAMIAFFN